MITYVLTWIRVRAINSLFFAIGILYLAYGCIIMRQCIMYSVCLSVCPSVCVNSCLGHNVFVLWRTHTIFSIWVYQYERMYCIHSWPTCDLWPYDLDFWPQGQRYKFSNLDYIWHISVSPWKDVSLTFMTSVSPWPWSQGQTFRVF